MMTAMFVINVDHTDEDDPDKNCNAMYIYSGPKFSPSPPWIILDALVQKDAKKVLVILKFLKISITSG